MKKFFVCVCAFIMALSMSVTAFAAIDLGTSPATNNPAGDYTIGVTSQYHSNSAAVISVDIAWENMEFTYNEVVPRAWDPITHQYIGTTEGSWNTDSKGRVTVTNHSNVAITARFEFDFDPMLDTLDKNIQGKFYELNDTHYTEIRDVYAERNLETAVGTTTDCAPSDTIFFGVTGSDYVATDTGAVGTITVSIAEQSRG